MRQKLRILYFPLVALALFGCALTDEEYEDPIDEQVVGIADKADAFGYREGSADAIGILRVANHVSLTDLKSKAKVSGQAAQAIVAARPFSTLVQLDAVPYVGRITFDRLLAYARLESTSGLVHYEASPRTPIHDNTITSTINVMHTGASGVVQVSVDITHSYVGDLRVKLRHGGVETILRERRHENTPDLKQTFTIGNFSALDRAGDWVLTVADLAYDDVGTLNRWAIDFGVVSAPDAGAPPPSPTPNDGGLPRPSPQCTTPTQPFVPDAPTHQAGKTKAVLTVPSVGEVGIYSERGWSNGSFYDYSLVRSTRGAAGWSSSSVASAGIGHSIARSLSATSNDGDPCVAYTFDYNATLHLQCASLSDRVVATNVSRGLAMASFGSRKEIVFVSGNGQELKHVTSEGNAPEIIDSANFLLRSSFVLDAAGTPHVAYVTQDSGATPRPRRIKYATKSGNSWTTEVVDSDAGSSDEGDVISIALDPNGTPVIAYFHRSTRSLKMATRAGGTFSLKTLASPRADGDANDYVGSSVALAIDNCGTRHLVFNRQSIFDPTPNLGLWYAREENGALVDQSPLPNFGSTAYRFAGAGWAHALSFVVTPDGHQHVAAQIGGIFGTAIYYASR